MQDLSMNIGAVKRVKRLLEVDLFDIISAPKGELSLLGKLSTDPALLVDVCYAVLKPQLDAAGIDDEQFGASLDGTKFAELREHFFKELGRFFMESGRPDQATAIARMGLAETLAIVDATKGIEGLDVQEVVRLAKLPGAGESTPGIASLSTQASAASTPTP